MVEENFQCPTFITDDKKKDMLPSFSHINELYELKKGKHEKMTYKISEQVLHPQVIEKSSVKMAEAVFHESTINALKYYASHGYNHFDDSASFTKIIRDWFNILNVKSIDYGVRKMDERRNAVQRESVTADLSYITKFTSGWNLGKENTSQLVCHNKHLMQLSVLAKPSYLFERYPNLNYILLGNVSSDFLEGRFGWWRQLCGGTFYNSVTQFLQVEKTNRLRSVVSMGNNMDEIKTIFDESNTISTLQQHEEIKCFINELEAFKLNDDSVLCDDEKAILYYIAGYNSKSLSKQACIQCNELLSTGKVPVNVPFLDIDQNVDKSSIPAKEVFITAGVV